ncbi:MAG: prenyltransferase [Bacillota bacterium]
MRDLKLKTILKDTWTASRPLSLTLAIYSTTLGISIAHLEGKLFAAGSSSLRIDILKIALVTAAGILVQTGTNLINDYFECGLKFKDFKGKKYKFLGKMRTDFDIYIFMLGMACFGATALIGLILVYLSTPKLIAVGIIGIIGGYSYTGEPIVYKRLGLGAILSFVLMGPLMVFGSYLVLAESFSWSPILLGLPVSLMIPLLMFSNELRDYQRDKDMKIRTLTVRLGFVNGKRIFLILLCSPYFLTLIFIFYRFIPLSALLVFVTLPLAIKSYRNAATAKKEGVPITNKLHLSFGLIYISSMLLM